MIGTSGARAPRQERLGAQPGRVPRVADAVDVHAHLVPDYYREGLAELGITRPDGAPLPAWSVQFHVATMDRLGIVTSVLSLSSPGVVPFGSRAAVWARRINDDAAGITQTDPGRFRFFAAVPLPDVSAACEEAARALDLPGAAGVGLLTQAGGVYLGDPELAPLMELLEHRRAVVFVHPTSPPGVEAVRLGRPAPLVEYLVDSSRAFVNLYANGVFDRYPSVRWIVAHNGALLPGLIDRVDLLTPYLQTGKVGASFADAAATLYYEIGSSAPFPRAAPAAAALTSPDHLLLGTDQPYAPGPAVEQNLARLRSGALVQGSLLAGLLGDNARSLLP